MVKSTIHDLFILAFRVYFGIKFAAIGWDKCTHLDANTDIFISLGVPFPEYASPLVAISELAAGVALTLGFFSSITSLLILIIMSSAYWIGHKAVILNAFNDPDALFKERPFLFWITAMMVFLHGPGRISLDALFRGKRHLKRD